MRLVVRGVILRARTRADQTPKLTRVERRSRALSAGNAACALALSSARRLGATSQRPLLRGSKRFSYLEQPERALGSRRDESLRPRSGFALNSAWHRRPVRHKRASVHVLRSHTRFRSTFHLRPREKCPTPIVVPASSRRAPSASISLHACRDRSMRLGWRGRTAGSHI